MTRRRILAAGLLFLALVLLPALPWAGTLDASGAPARGSGERIVSVGGAVTEIIYALGMFHRVVAVDSTSRFPETVRSRPDVGYMRRLASEPILAMEPSLVLAVADAGPPAVLDQLREAGLRVEMIPDDPSPRGVLDKIERVGVVLGRADSARALAAGLGAKFTALKRAVAALPSRPRVLFLLSIGQGGAPLASGRKTAAAGIIELAGGINAVDAFEGYKPLSPEAAVAAAPDVILVTRRSLDLLGGVDGLLGIPEIGLTPAGGTRRVVAMDGLLLLGFGPRTAAAAERLARRLHPALWQSLYDGSSHSPMVP